MRITEIEIKNFRAFYGSYQINLHRSGKNLLIYGENGSGKSSLYLALKLFLESAVNDHPFEVYQNIFVEDSDSGYIKLSLRADQRAGQRTYEWSKTIKETTDPLIADASKTKGFLDYKTLLATHYVQREEDSVNVFDLLVNNLLANTINDITNQSFADDWADIQRAVPRRNTKRQIEMLEELIQNFNIGLSNKLEELKEKASEILGKFEYNVALDFNFRGVSYNQDDKTLGDQRVLLKVQFFDRDLLSHHHFLNEAKLSAIAVAVSLSSFLLQPESDLKILALDDLLIGLDMSNRLPVIDILKDYFVDYQIFFLTYDRAWYEIVKQRMLESEWKYVHFYFSKTDEYEIPIYVEDQLYLEKAKEYFDVNDYKACVIYLRTAFEVIIKRFCEKMDLHVKYRENLKDLTSEDFWIPIKKKNEDMRFLEETTIRDIDLYRSKILNPLSHSSIVISVKREIGDAIKVVEDLKTKLENVKK